MLVGRIVDDVTIYNILNPTYPNFHLFWNEFNDELEGPNMNNIDNIYFLDDLHLLINDFNADFIIINECNEPNEIVSY